MRLDARKGDFGWTTYHAEECRILNNVVWIDDATAQWCEYVEPKQIVGNVFATRLCQARKIVILLAAKFVMINPIEDSEIDGVLRQLEETT